MSLIDNFFSIKNGKMLYNALSNIVQQFHGNGITAQNLHQHIDLCRKKAYKIYQQNIGHVNPSSSNKERLMSLNKLTVDILKKQSQESRNRRSHTQPQQHLQQPLQQPQHPQVMNTPITAPGMGPPPPIPAGIDSNEMNGTVNQMLAARGYEQGSNQMGLPPQQIGVDTSQYNHKQEGNLDTLLQQRMNERGGSSDVKDNFTDNISGNNGDPTIRSINAQNPLELPQNISKIEHLHKMIKSYSVPKGMTNLDPGSFVQMLQYPIEKLIELKQTNTDLFMKLLSTVKGYWDGIKSRKKESVRRRREKQRILNTRKKEDFKSSSDEEDSDADDYEYSSSSGESGVVVGKNDTYQQILSEINPEKKIKIKNNISEKITSSTELLSLNFEMNLIDISTNGLIYSLGFDPISQYNKLSMKSCMINLHPVLQEEPYFYIKIKEVDGCYRVGRREKVFGKIVPHKITDQMVIYTPEYCQGEINNKDVNLDKLTLSFLKPDLSFACLHKIDGIKNVIRKRKQGVLVINTIRSNYLIPGDKVNLNLIWPGQISVIGGEIIEVGENGTSFTIDICPEKMSKKMFIERVSMKCSFTFEVC